jgi:hypothetical protein
VPAQPRFEASEMIRLLSLGSNPKFSLLFIETRTEIERNWLFQLSSTRGDGESQRN